MSDDWKALRAMIEAAGVLRRDAFTWNATDDANWEAFAALVEEQTIQRCAAGERSILAMPRLYGPKS